MEKVMGAWRTLIMRSFVIYIPHKTLLGSPNRG